MSRHQTESVNIGGVEDAFYRYKMPKIVTKIEGRGNGIRTVLPNISSIGDALKRPPEYIIRFFGFELGSISKYDPEKKVGWVNGNHPLAVVNQKLSQFIQLFVLCQKCKNPETECHLTGESLTFHCIACGHNFPAPPHRLSASMLKDALSQFAASKHRSREAKKGAVPKKPKEETPDEPQENKESMAIKKPKAPQEEAHPSPEHPSETEEEQEPQEWFADVSTEAAEKRRLEALNNLSERGAHTLLGTSAPTQTTSSTPAPQASTTTLTPAPVLIIPDHAEDHPVMTLFEKTFPASGPALDEAALDREHSTFLSLVTTEVGQRCLLIVLERVLLARNQLVLLPRLAKKLYDLDLVDEEILLHWYGNPETTSQRYGVPAPGAASARQTCKPLVDWLKTAEEEDEEEEEQPDQKELDALIDSL